MVEPVKRDINNNPEKFNLFHHIILFSSILTFGIVFRCFNFDLNKMKFVVFIFNDCLVNLNHLHKR